MVTSSGALRSIVAALLVLFAGGCASSRSAGFNEGDAGSAIAPDAAGASFDGSILGDSNTMPPGNGCSADLHNVIGPGGNVIQQCPPDQGCSGGTCVPACQAAADSKGSVGCDFMVSTPPFVNQFLPPCFAAFVANNWNASVTIDVSLAGQTLDVTAFGRIPDGTPTAANWPTVSASGLPAGNVAVLFLSSDPAAKHPNGTPLTCPVPDAVGHGTGVFDPSAFPYTFGSGRAKAFHVVTSAPVSLYDILPYGAAKSFLPSAELVLPTTAWGTNYLTVIPRTCSTCGSTGGPPWLQITAAEDGTNVQVRPTAPLPAGPNVVLANPGQVTTYTLAAGEMIQWVRNDELSGSVFASDKPVSVSAGSTYLCLSSGTSPMGGGCDAAHQLMPPVSALGFEYVASPFATRRADMQPESIPYRLVGAKDGTLLTYDPPGAGPSTLSSGQFADFELTGPFTITSQDNDHVFYVTQMMPGCQVTGGSRPGITPGVDVQLGLTECFGDEEFLDVLPPAQWLSRYVFFTDPTYGTTNLTVTRMKSPTGFKDVSIDCIGTVTGWKPVGSGGKYEVTDTDLVRATKGTGSCTNGGHVATSDAPFGLVVWGLDEFASYAYPAGGNVASINTVVVPTTK